MPRAKADDASPRYQFVGGATLKGRTGGIRSLMIRRTLSDRTRERRDVQGKTVSTSRPPDHLLCDVCRASHVGLGSSGPPRYYRPIRPRTGPATRMLPALCQTCGERLAAIKLHLYTFLASHIDLFLPFDSDLAGIKVQHILKFATTHIWPNMRPLDYSADCYRGWTFMWEDKLRVYGMLWSACFQRDMLRLVHGPPGQEIDSREQLHLRALTIQHLREEVANIDAVTAPDGLVLSTLFLAMNIAPPIKAGGAPSPFSPPFRNLHSLQAYGDRQFHPMHWRVLHEIIRRFGGFASLRMFALAFMLSLADLMTAVNNLEKPVYPALGVYGQVLDLQPPLSLFPMEPPSKAGLGFLALGDLSPPISQAVINVFADIGQYSRVIQHYSTDACSPEVLDLLGDSRNQVHNRLFSLPDEKDDLRAVLECCRGHSEAQITLSQDIYLLVRLSVILYAIHVSFPIPHSGRLRDRLLTALRPQFSRLIHRAPESLVLWCLVIAIVSSGDSPSGQLLGFAARLCLALKIDSKEKLLRLLGSFAWVETAVPDTAPFWSLVGNLFAQAHRAEPGLIILPRPS
ncbi:hypothetical protein BJX68DRAFT_269056 [Aspergillus pseudodeflectus]|uniref:Uncharacterized protein n=1 Tax=Aspergillus pseudodeflectus TaxID=176178 RepID=A0ABR4JZM0_9EURO